MDFKMLGTFASAAIVSAGLVGGSVAVWANALDRNEAKTRQSPTAPVEDQLPEEPAVDKDALPRVHGPFLLVPPDFERPLFYSYGDERDSWTWRSATTSTFDDVPRDPKLARLPELPDGYALSEISYTVGTSPDGERIQLSEIHLTYLGENSPDVTIHLWRAIELALGEPFAIVVPDDENRDGVSLIEIADRAAVYSYQHASAVGGGVQTLYLSDEDVMIAVESYRGSAFATFQTVAESLVR